MRFMVIVKATPESEAIVQLSSEQLAGMAEMGRFNEGLIKAGVMLAADGLQPSAKGVRIKFDGEKRTLTDGPFAETKELIAGYWLIDVKSKAEAIEWMSRAPFDGGTEIELRPLFELDDFAPVIAPEVRAQKERLQAQLDAK